MEAVESNADSVKSGASDGGLPRDRSGASEGGVPHDRSGASEGGVPRNRSGASEGGVPRDRSGASEGGVPRNRSGAVISVDSGASERSVVVGGGGDVFGEGGMPDRPEPLAESQLNKVPLALDTFGVEVVR